MRKGIAPFGIALAIMLSLTACNKKKADEVKPVAPSDQAQGALTWMLTFKSKCAEAEGNGCVGQHGFSILPDGRYQVGPGPGDEKRVGVLDEGDFKKVDSFMSSLSAQTLLSMENHAAIEPIDHEDVVTLQKGTGSVQTVLRASGADLYYNVKSEQEAGELLQVLRSLAEKYYVLPFPDSCLDSASVLESLFDTHRTCSSDKDCSFFGEFQKVAGDSTNFLITDDCSVVKPIYVGNTALVSASQGKLKEELGKLKEACGEKFMRRDCGETSGIQLPGYNPVCKRGKCQAVEVTE